MSETIKSEPVYYTKDFDGYTQSENNFVANQELTVTITLNEYRDLVKANSEAEAEVRKAKSDAYAARREADDLKAKLIESMHGSDGDVDDTGDGENE